MARIRSIKPDFWTDSKIVNLSPLARLFYIGLWNFAICDMGHIKNDPDALKLQILPTDDVDGGDLIAELLKAGRVVTIELDDGRSFLYIPRFADHQNISVRWSPRCAACQKQQPTLVKIDEPSAKVAKFGEVSPKMTRRGREGRGREGKNNNTSSPASLVMVEDDAKTDPEEVPAARKPTAVDSPEFVRFWDAYPRKVGKGEARKAWAKVAKSDVDLDAVIRGAERYRDDPARRRKGDEYTKHPGPWLNAERWTDQLNGNDLAPTTGWWDN